MLISGQEWWQSRLFSCQLCTEGPTRRASVAGRPRFSWQPRERTHGCKGISGTPTLSNLLMPYCALSFSFCLFFSSVNMYTLNYVCILGIQIICHLVDAVIYLLVVPTLCCTELPGAGASPSTHWVRGRYILVRKWSKNWHQTVYRHYKGHHVQFLLTLSKKIHRLMNPYNFEFLSMIYVLKFQKLSFQLQGEAVRWHPNSH